MTCDCNRPDRNCCECLQRTTEISVPIAPVREMVQQPPTLYVNGEVFLNPEHIVRVSVSDVLPLAFGEEGQHEMTIEVELSDAGREYLKKLEAERGSDD